MATANVKAIISADDRASGVISGVGNSFGKLAGAVGVGTLAAQGFSKALDAVVNAGKSAIKQAASFEQTRIGLENMLGSADKARALLGDISKFAAETPFEFPELAQATRQLVAFGFNAEDAFGTMKQLGDVSAAVGAPINDLAYLMGTLRTQGRAFTVDIRQFAQRGIPIYEYLAKVLKTNEQAIAGMIEAGKIGFPEVQKAFEMMTAEGGKFHGTMAKQSKSLDGLFSTLKDTFGQLGRELVGITTEGDIVAGSVFDRLRNATAGLIEALPRLISQMKEIANSIVPVLKDWAVTMMNIAINVGQFLQPKLQALWETIVASLPTWEKFYNEILKPLAQLLGVALVTAIALVIDGLNLLLTILKPVLEVMAANKEMVFLLVGAFAALKVAMMVQGAVAAFTTAMAAARTQIAITRGALAAPWAMPAIAVAAAVASLWEVKKAADAIRQAVNDVNNAANAAANLANEGQMRTLQQQATKARAMGDTAAAARYANALRAMGGNALGGNVQAGVPRIVGEQGKEVFIPTQSGKIVPNHEIGGGGQINITVQAGAFMGSQQDAREYAMRIAEALKDVAGMKGTSVTQMLGA